MPAEFLYRAVSAGFYGSLTQSFRKAQSTATRIVVPVVSHSIELPVHILRHTPNIKTSVISSVIFTMISTLFHAKALRRGVLVCGPNQGQTILGFEASAPVGGRLCLLRALGRLPLAGGDVV